MTRFWAIALLLAASPAVVGCGDLTKTEPEATSKESEEAFQEKLKTSLEKMAAESAAREAKLKKEAEAAAKEAEGKAKETADNVEEAAEAVEKKAEEAAGEVKDAVEEKAKKAVDEATGNAKPPGEKPEN